jgi:hypothetical protein
MKLTNVTLVHLTVKAMCFKSVITLVVVASKANYDQKCGGSG